MSFQRLKLHRLMEKTGCECLFILDTSKVRKIIKRPLENSLLLVFADKLVLVTSEINRCFLSEKEDEFEIVFAEASIWIDALFVLATRQCERIGIDPYNTPYALIILAAADLNLEWVNVSEEMTEIFSCKDESETECLIQATLVAEEVLENTVEKLHDGITEKAVADCINSELLMRTGEFPGFSTIVAFGENSQHPHWNAGTRRLIPGDSVIIDCSATFNGYYSDIARTYFWKKAASKQLTRYRVVLETFNLAMYAITPGEKCSHIAEIISSNLMKFNLHQYNPYPVGHGIGTSVHEFPIFTLDSEDVLMIDMVFCLEPGIFVPDWGGVRIEDVFQLTEDGAVRLGKLPSDNPVIS